MEQGLKTEGYHYWNGNEWRIFNSYTTIINPIIQKFTCTYVTFNPPIFTAGVPYNGVTVVPYTGGNGGAYPAGIPLSSTDNTGLIAQLRSGYLANGNGELVYDLTQIPSQ
ncbi:hypothetical protein [Chryseobacterium jejuense]|uniref:hypothetical protein n=1 Tax=Chryseobacterium jejuense TaxID=445960 RepID=UPI001AE7582B|nr:hypothetical protein [Chryseobacterium jejuense]MBP2618112.1 hypothetical protein [Chryseobacterium jejuense]